MCPFIITLTFWEKNVYQKSIPPLRKKIVRKPTMQLVLFWFLIMRVFSFLGRFVFFGGGTMKDFNAILFASRLV